MMFRSDLMARLSGGDGSDEVVVGVGGILVEIAGTTQDSGVVTIDLDPEDSESALGQIHRKMTAKSS